MAMARATDAAPSLSRVQNGDSSAWDRNTMISSARFCIRSPTCHERTRNTNVEATRMTTALRTPSARERRLEREFPAETLVM
jgi:hypothetical protein